MDPLVIYDSELEMAALVDAETLRGIGPVSVGPNARAELNTFVQVMPSTVISEMHSYALATAYKEYWQREFAALYQDPPADTGTVEPLGAPRDDGAALAQHEAAGSGDGPPAPQPADTDLGADQGQADALSGAREPDAGRQPPAPARTRIEEVTCFACDGAGTVPGASADQPVRCNLCGGKGRVVQEVPA